MGPLTVEENAKLDAINTIIANAVNTMKDNMHDYVWHDSAGKFCNSQTAKQKALELARTIQAAYQTVVVNLRNRYDVMGRFTRHEKSKYVDNSLRILLNDDVNVAVFGSDHTVRRNLFRLLRKHS